MRQARALALLLLVVLLAPVTGMVGTASAGEDTLLTITGQPRVGVYHDEIGPETPDVVRHRGRLTTAGGAPIVGATVELQRTLVGGDEASEEATTDAEGR